ncbi:MAG TPA: hypothetical protein VGX97_00470 [bacterium]|nr:hypothetical protein [bacterium]
MTERAPGRLRDAVSGLTDGQLDTAYHPNTREDVPPWRVPALFAWHGRHHTAQIEWVRQHRL